MHLETLVRAVRRQRRLVLLCAGVGAVVVFGLSLRSGPVFEATSQVYLTTAPGAAPVEAAALAQKAQTYTRLVTSEQVSTAVAKDVSLPYPSEQLAQHVSATSEPGTVLLDIRVRDASPGLARDIADSVAVHLAETVKSLESPDASSAPSVTLTVTKRAVPAREPIGPNRLRDTGLGALLGLLAGLSVVGVRALGDRSVRTRAHVEARGGHLLSEIPDDDSASKLPLILADPFSARAEGIRRLRTNLRGGSRTASGRPVRSVVVTSALPGEGRTTTACNLAIALAQNGDEVVLVDADLRRGALADVMDISATTGLTNVLSGERPLAEALHTWRPELPLRVLPSGPLPPNPSEVAGSAQLAALVATLTDNGLTVVLDSPPLLPVTDAALLASATDGAVVVVRSGTSTREDLQACLDALSAGGARSLGVVLNRATGRTLTLPPAAASPRRRRADVRHAKAPEPPARSAPPDTLAGSVTSWYDEQYAEPAAAQPIPAAAPMPAGPAPMPIHTMPAQPVEPAPVAAVYRPASELRPLQALPEPVLEVLSRPVQLPLPSPQVPRQTPHYDPSAAAVPPTAPISTPPTAMPVAPTDARPGSRREARRRLAAVPDEDTRQMPRPVVRHEVATQKVDLREVTPRVPSLGAADNGSVWAPPWQSR